MKMFTVCPKCMKMDFGPNVSQGIGNLTEEGFIEFTCEYNHCCKILLQEFKFEYLFYAALRHFINAEYEETIMLFTSSLERFYEFFIIMYTRKLTKNDDFVDNKLIKTIHLSERQLGAFMLLYFIVFNENPPEVDKNKELRNNVIHNGVLAKKEDAEKYGKYVYNIIVNTIKKVKINDEELIQNEVEKHMDYLNKKLQGQNIDGTFSCYINFTTTNEISTFEDLIETTKRMEEMISPTAISERKEGLELQKKQDDYLLKVVKGIIDKTEPIKGIDYPLKESNLKINRYLFENGIKKYTLRLYSATRQYKIQILWINDTIKVESIDEVK